MHVVSYDHTMLNAPVLGSRLITKVKQHWAGLVLLWVTAWEWVMDGLRSISAMSHTLLNLHRKLC